MPHILYAGVKYIQIRHAVQCRKCLETIESLHPHDFKQCSCGAIGIDGGIEEGNRIIGDKADINNRSVYCATINNKRIWLPQALICNKIE
jgi:hypothetical protein